MIARRTRFAAGLGTLLLAATTLVTVAPEQASAAPVTIQLLNINDFHGRIDPNTTRWATTIEQQRALYPTSTLLLGAGDLIGASVFASAVANDQPTIDVLNAMDLSASAVGNHEFDKGWADLRDRVIAGGTNAEWDYLAANITDANGPILPPYEIYPVGGLDVAVIGAVTLETPTIVSPGGIAGLTFTDPVDAVNTYAAQLSDGNAANGEADVIVAEYHEGGPETEPPGTLQSGTTASPIFNRIVNNTSGAVDVIFTGHSHKAYTFDAPIPGDASHTRPIVQTGEYGNNIGRVTLSVDDTTGAVDYAATTSTVVPRVATADLTLPRVGAVDTIVTAALANAAVQGSVPKGSITGDITRAYSDGSYTGTPPVWTGGATTDRTVESSLGNVVADALLSTLGPEQLGGAEIGVVNPGGLREDMVYAPDGVVTYAEANAVLPFVNNLWTVTLTGTQFKALLEQQWRTGAYLQLGLSQNVSYTFDSTLPVGSRITSIVVDGEPIDPAAQYRIGSFSFLIQGGDAFTVFTQGTDVRDSGLVDRDGWIAYLEAHPNLAPDFAKQSAEIVPLPTAVVPGVPLQFTASKLNLASRGAPQNTTLRVAVGGVEIGTVPIANGTAAVDLVVPNTVPSGSQPLTLLAEPSNTLVTIPVEVPAAIVPLSPERILDTRPGAPTIDGKFAGIGIREAGTTLELEVAGRGGVPADATSVVLNLTATDGTGTGYVTVWACGSPRPIASSLNFVAGVPKPNAVLTGIGTGGKVCIYTAEANAQLIADVNGLLPADGGYAAVVPARLLETRVGAPTSDGVAQGEGPRAAGSTYTLQVNGRGNVPADAAAVALNVTATDSSGTGYITVWDCAEPRPLASSVNFVEGVPSPNSVLTKVSASGKVCFYVAEASTELIVDVFGYLEPGAAFGALTPARLLETRAGAPTVDGVAQGAGPLATGTPLELQVAGRGGVPASARGAVLNVTATDAPGTGFVTVWPCGEPMPTASNVNFVAGVPSPNAAIVKIGADGKVCFQTGQSSAQLIVDVTAYL